MILKQKGSVLTITGEVFQKLLANPRPILWCNDGLYGMIPIERVKNFLAIMTDKSIYKTQFKWHFVWNEAVEIPQETGRVMEKFNGGGK